MQTPDTKYIIVHQDDIYMHEGRDDLTASAAAALASALNTLNALKEKALATIVVNKQTIGHLTDKQITEALVMLDDLSAWELETSGVIQKFVRDVGIILIYGAYEDVCIGGLCSVLNNIGVAYEVVRGGTIKLFDGEKKLYPPI